jgi:uncharacterized membrane protein HdeD (DUF308 family)
MNAIKQILGVIVALMGPAIVIFGIIRAIKEIGEKPTQENYIFWIIILTIFLPIAIGFTLFGYYAFRGEYQKLEA